MMEEIFSKDEEDQGKELLEKWLPLLCEKKKAFLKGAAEALYYVQEEEKKMCNKEKNSLKTSIGFQVCREKK